jgi:hypothetical protein
MHPVLEQMQRNADRDTEFSVEAEFSEAKEIFTKVLREITTDKLLATVIESASSISTSTGVKCWTKELSIV